MTKAPAFQFYPADFLSDENVALMSLAGRGAYITLICYCWREGSIPTDVARLGRLCGVDSSTMAQLWPEVEACFEKAGDRYYQPRLERERIKQREFSNERQETGRRGAELRWQKAKATQVAEAEENTRNDDPETEDSSAIAEPMAQPIANDSPSVFSLQSSTSSSEKEKQPSRAKRASAKRPTTCDEDFLAELQSNPAYAMFDVTKLYHRMVAWCQNKGVQPTRSRLINWLNREDKPMGYGGNNGQTQTGKNGNGADRGSAGRTTEDYGIRDCKVL